MQFKNSIPIVDLFAGPGGLGEGFSSAKGDPFRIVVSAEMEASAHATLRLRAFYRILKRKGGPALQSYYRFCNGETRSPFDQTTQSEWNEADNEALQLTLGDAEDNKKIDAVIKAHRLGPDSLWVLIGGPPCQAYSLVGRSRNQGKKDYNPEHDHRHFLYREYLRIIQQYRPAVFVMENVKGILSSSVGGDQIFHTILRDLADPDTALGKKTSGIGYRIHSLSHPTYFEKSKDPDDIDARDFILYAEQYGIPQARHRVILLGVRDDLDITPSQLKNSPIQSTVSEAISSLPRLRSKLSKQVDSCEAWAWVVNNHFNELSKDASPRADLTELGSVLGEYAAMARTDLSTGALRLPRNPNSSTTSSLLEKWYHDEKLRVWLNHETRGHMAADLRRYAYASAFARAYGRSPKGHTEFELEGLTPKHQNWESGKFSDRFRVQLHHRPATTVTSHISKDGHYFIHPDPSQCRSLTVREAARLQTFPDNYFFQGNRTQQFHQVGNAVPPLLALKIAEVVKSLIDEVRFKGQLSA